MKNERQQEMSHPLPERFSEEDLRALKELGLDVLFSAALAKFSLILERMCEQDSIVAQFCLDVNVRFCAPALIPYMAVEDGSLLVNPQFVMDYSDTVIEMVLKHEARHIKYEHHQRFDAFLKSLGPNADGKTWEKIFNAAADLEINSEILTPSVRTKCQASGFDSGVVPGVNHFEGWPVGLRAEEYAIRIMDSPPHRDLIIGSMTEIWDNMAKPTNKEGA